MEAHSREAAPWAAQLAEIERGIAAAVSVAATELRAPPVDPEKISGVEIELINRARQFAQYFQTLTQAQARELARRQAAGEPTVLPPDWQSLMTRAGLVRLWMNRWPEIRQLINDQSPSKRRRLYRKPSRDEPMIATQNDAGNEMVDILHRVLNPKAQSEEAESRGCYGDIALPNSLFLEHMHAAYRLLLAQETSGPSSFLDVGCGGGLKVLAATGFFDRADGLEFDRGYAASARRLFKQVPERQCRVTCTDALGFKRYDDYDVIYLYRPIEDHEGMTALERRIVERARPGTVLVAPYLGFNDRHADLGCACVEDALFLVRSTKAEAARLRRRAELTGPSVPQPEKSNTISSMWSPIIKASRSNGFDVGRERQRFPA